MQERLREREREREMKGEEYAEGVSVRERT